MAHVLCSDMATEHIEELKDEFLEEFDPLVHAIRNKEDFEKDCMKESEENYVNIGASLKVEIKDEKLDTNGLDSSTLPSKKGRGKGGVGSQALKFREPKSYPCNLCDFKTDRKGSLKMHHKSACGAEILPLQSV